jgi:uncharacterized membrane protein required for colicin V production
MDRTWLDIGVVLVIGIFTLIGLSSGFVFSLFRIISTVVSLFLSVTFYGKIADVIRGTYAEEVLSTFIYDRFRQNPSITAAQKNLDIDGVYRGISRILNLPESLAEKILIKPQSLDELPRTSLFEDIDIIKFFSDNCTKMVIYVLSFIALFVAIRVVISIIKIFLDEVAAIKQLNVYNYALAPILGFIEGVIVVYIVLAFLMSINTVIQIDLIFGYIDRSVIGKAMYENNFFVEFFAKRAIF